METINRLQKFASAITFLCMICLIILKNNYNAVIVIGSILIIATVINAIAFFNTPTTPETKKNNTMLYISLGLTVLIAVAFFISTL